MFNDEARLAHRGEGFAAGDHVGNAVAALDGEADCAVAFVGRVVGVGHYPFVDAEDGAGFEDAVDLGVDGCEGGGVDGGFDGVGGIESVLGEVDFLQ